MVDWSRSCSLIILICRADIFPFWCFWVSTMDWFGVGPTWIAVKWFSIKNNQTSTKLSCISMIELQLPGKTVSHFSGWWRCAFPICNMTSSIFLWALDHQASFSIGPVGHPWWCVTGLYWIDVNVWLLFSHTWDVDYFFPPYLRLWSQLIFIVFNQVEAAIRYTCWYSLFPHDIPTIYDPNYLPVINHGLLENHPYDVPNKSSIYFGYFPAIHVEVPNAIIFFPRLIINFIIIIPCLGIFFYTYPLVI